MNTDSLKDKLEQLRHFDWTSLWSGRHPLISKKRLVAVALGVLVVTLFYVAQNSQAVLYARSLRVKQERLAQLERENAQLEAEIAALTSPSALEPRARALGLAPAKNVIYADVPPMSADIADVLPAFVPQTQTPSMKSDLSTQFALWWDSVKLQLGLSRNGTVRAAGE